MRTLKISELKQGMVLAAPIFVKEKLMLKIGTRLTKGMIQNLIATGLTEADIADRYTLLVNPKETLTPILDRYMQMGILKMAPDDIEANKCDKMVEVSKRARKIASEIVRMDDVLDLCVQMQITDNKNILCHGINTSILAMLVAGAMDLSEKEIRDIGVAGLLQNLGVCEMPFLINKKDLNKQEELLWKEHSTYGYYFALQNNISHDIANLILYHHERYDGTGYPKQLKANEIPLGARILNLCCDYDKLVTIKGSEPYYAIEYIYGGSGSYYDKDVVNAFTQNISVYPLGSLVRLTTKEIGVVVNVRKNQGPRPMVQVYYNRVNKPLSVPKVVDLAVEKTIFIEEIITLV
ncbi:MAG: metal dependent phosphohydrolase [Clostridiales bacterium]|jgi:response regulator RpfG family c-di-GMP phosphodiesterase|nr:metal dependent phosphohydrolase [Clostridiales bacterium]